MTIRKNFLFDEEVARHLEEIAKHENKTMTDVVQEAVEERYRKIKKERRLMALKHLKGIADGALGDISIQKIKAEDEL